MVVLAPVVSTSPHLGYMTLLNVKQPALKSKPQSILRIWTGIHKQTVLARLLLFCKNFSLERSQRQSPQTTQPYLAQNFLPF